MSLTTEDVKKVKEWFDAQPEPPEYITVPVDLLCAIVSVASGFTEDGVPIEKVN